MLPSIDLRLAHTGLQQLAATPYFDPSVLRYSEQLCKAIEFALVHEAAMPILSLKRLAEIAWISHQYLAGSISREAPYEVEFCLKQALDEWKRKECIIITHLSHLHSDFSFMPADPWDMIKGIIPAFDASGFDHSLILISLPRLYRHKPIFCVPLYHELGHYIDRQWAVTSTVQLLNVSKSPGSQIFYPNSHWAEYFADLFAVCYAGESQIGALEVLASGYPASNSHPATSDRLKLMRDFLSGVSDPRIEAIQHALSNLNAPALTVRFQSPVIDKCFDDLVPYRIQSVSEIHGLFQASWIYFQNARQRRSLPWSKQMLDDGKIEQVVNDLTEKTIRNYSIKSRWANGSNQKI